MDAEQGGAAEVAANVFGGKRQVFVLPAGLEYRCGKKARCAKTRTGLRYCLQGLGRGVKHVGASCALNVNVNKARGRYAPLCVEDAVSGGGGVGLADFRD
jgi:hypothetical protein